MAQKVRAKRLPKSERIKLILDAARIEFEERGYIEAKVADIAERIGVVEGTIYSYFASKRELLDQLIADWYREQSRVQQDGIASIKSLPEKLRFVLRLHLKTMTEHRRFCAVLLKESRGLGGHVANIVHEMNRDYTRIFRELVQEGVDRGELRANLKVSQMRNLLYGAMEHLFWDAIYTQQSVDIDAEVDELMELVFFGVVARKPEARSSKNKQASESDRLSRQIDRLEVILKNKS